MAEDIIKSEDIIAPNVFQPTIDQAKELQLWLTKLEQGFKSIAQTTAGGISKNDPTSIDDLKKQQELNEKLAKTLEGLTDVQKQNLIIQEKIKQLTTGGYIKHTVKRIISIIKGRIKFNNKCME